MKWTLLLSYLLRVSLFFCACLLIMFDSWLIALAIVPVVVLDYLIHKKSTRQVSMGLIVMLITVQFLVFGILGLKLLVYEEESNYFLESLNGPDTGRHGDGFVDQVKASYTDISEGKISSGVQNLRYSASKAIVDHAKQMHHSLGIGVDKSLAEFKRVTDLISLSGDKVGDSGLDEFGRSKGEQIEWRRQHSSTVIRSAFGVLPNTTFPDLMHRSSEEVMTSLGLIFSELPDEFSEDYVNPCWEEESDHPPLDHQKKATDSNVVSKAAAKAAAAKEVKGMHCLPAFYLLGQPKCGTTDLFARLVKHHDIHAPIKKELRWFTPGEFYSQKYRPNDVIDNHTSIREYTKRFTRTLRHIKDSPSRAITLDGGPHTFWWPLQAPDGSDAPPGMIPPPQIIREMTPDAKFLVTLSNPVSRMYSDYYFLNDDKSMHEKPKKARLRGAKTKGRDILDTLDNAETLTEKSPEIFHERAVEQVKNFHECVSSHMNSSAYLDNLSGSHALSGSTAAAVSAFLSAKTDENIHEQLSGMSAELKQVVVGRWFRASQICAHDRHSFAVAGWGRLSIGLYGLYYEKWLEHFPPSQFKIVRLEDYETSPREYLKEIFAFLKVDMPVDEDEWNAIISPATRNKHHTDRLPMLPETKKLLEQFYRPYNVLLAKSLRDKRFVWSDFMTSTPQHPDGHSPDALMTRGDADQDEKEKEVKTKVSQKQRQLEHEISSFNAQAFSLEGLRQPPPYVPSTEANSNEESSEFNLFVRTVVHRRDSAPRSVDFKDHTGFEEVCAAAYGLDFAALKYLLWEVGVPGAVADKRRVTPLHCLASVYTMSEASSKSMLFSMLKGVDSWLSPMIGKSMPVYAKSVRSMDIVETLAPAVVEVAKWLLAAGGDVNHATAPDGETPLHLACVGGFVPLVKFLLEHGADPNILNNQWKTPLHYCLAYGRAEAGALLVMHGAQVDEEDIHNVTARKLLETRGTVSVEDAFTYFNVTQHPVRTLKNRPLHPEYPDTAPHAARHNGGWDTTRLQGFEDDMHCDVDQYELDEISGVDVFEKYIAQGRPILLRAGEALAKNWPALEMYSRAGLSKEFGNEFVTASSIPYADKFGGSATESLTIAEYINEMTHHNLTGGSHPWYVFKGSPINKVNKAKEEGHSSVVDFDLIPTPLTIAQVFNYIAQGSNYDSAITRGDKTEFIVQRNRKDFINAQWALGGAGTGAPVHFHNTAWNALVYGAKKWLLYPPNDMIMSNVQILEFVEKDMKKFETRTDFKPVKPLTCVQTSGDIMIVPESWGHGVLNIQDSIAVATESKFSMWRIKIPLPFTKKLVELSPQRKEKRGGQGSSSHDRGLSE